MKEMTIHIPPKGETKEKFKDPKAPKRPPPAFFLSCSEYRPKSQESIPGGPLVTLQGGWGVAPLQEQPDAKKRGAHGPGCTPSAGTA